MDKENIKNQQIDLNHHLPNALRAKHRYLP